MWLTAEYQRRRQRRSPARIMMTTVFFFLHRSHGRPQTPVAHLYFISFFHEKSISQSVVHKSYFYKTYNISSALIHFYFFPKLVYHFCPLTLFIIFSFSPFRPSFRSRPPPPPPPLHRYASPVAAGPATGTNAKIPPHLFDCVRGVFKLCGRETKIFDKPSL